MTGAGAITGVRPADRRARLGTAAEHLGLGLLPVVLTIALIGFVFAKRLVAVDFHDAYWVAGHRLLAGGGPYSWSAGQIAGGVAFVYPALSAVLFAPFALIARGPSEILFMFLCIASVPAALWALDIRDWRVYGVVMLWLPVFSGWQAANLTLPLTLGLALLWRHRDRPVIAGLLVAVIVSLKPFMWPAALWLVATRRWRASIWALVLGVAINLAAWAVVGYGEISRYLHLSSAVTTSLERTGYGVVAVVSHLGIGRGVGSVVELALSLALAVACAVVGWSGRERRALTLAVGLMLVASPLVWIHYFALLLVPFAVLRPRLCAIWFAPILLSVCPPSYQARGWEEGVAWVVAVLCLTALLRPSHDRSIALPARTLPAAA